MSAFHSHVLESSTLCKHFLVLETEQLISNTSHPHSHFLSLSSPTINNAMQHWPRVRRATRSFSHTPPRLLPPHIAQDGANKAYAGKTGNYWRHSLGQQTILETCFTFSSSQTPPLMSITTHRPPALQDEQ